MVDEEEGDMKNDPHIPGWRIKLVMEKRNILRFEKKLNAKEAGIVRMCHGCGASLSINTSGKCPYCDRIYEIEDYDYVLVSISVK